jgi:hypothetical protein
MTGPQLGNLSPKQREAMCSVLTAWQSSRASTKVLQEGLQVLSSRDRPISDRILKQGRRYAGVTCTYGRGHKRTRLTLSRHDAGLMLGIVSPILRAANGNELAAKQMVGIAADVLIRQKPVPSTITDPMWTRVLGILAEVAPTAGQTSLFQ